MSGEGGADQTGGGGGDTGEAMSVDSDSGFNDGSSVASPGSEVSALSWSSSSTVTGPPGHSAHSVDGPGHSQHSSSGHGSFTQSHPGYGQQHPGQTLPGQHVGPPSVDSGISTGTTIETAPGQQVGPSSVDSGISTGTTIPSGQAAYLPTEKVDRKERTDKWAEETFQVFVTNLDGKKHTIEVTKDEEVSVFRKKVSQKLGIPDQQVERLTLQSGKTLQAGRKLRDHEGFQKHCNIYCQGRLRGG